MFFLKPTVHKYIEETQCAIGPYNPFLIIDNDNGSIWRTMDFVLGYEAEYNKSF